MNVFFYECSASSELGKKISRFHHACLKADEAAENFAKKMGAKAYYSDPSAFAGGVNCLEFEEFLVDKQMWRPAEVVNGVQCYEPAVNVVAGAILIDDIERFRPSDTRIRIYAKQPVGWEQVRQFYTMYQWAARIGYQLTGDKEADGKWIIEQLENRKFLQFMEFYGQQQPSRKGNKRSRAFLRAVRAEQQRMRLPVIPVQELYHILQADLPVGDGSADAEKEPSTPTFFLYQDSYYIGVSYPCHHRDLQPITKQRYTYIGNMLKLFLKRSASPS